MKVFSDLLTRDLLVQGDGFYLENLGRVQSAKKALANSWAGSGFHSGSLMWTRPFMNIVDPLAHSTNSHVHFLKAILDNVQ